VWALWKIAGTDARCPRFGRREGVWKGWYRVELCTCEPCPAMPPEDAKRPVGRPGISIPSEMDARKYGAVGGGGPDGGG
jgi:hypothetical protein